MTLRKQLVHDGRHAITLTCKIKAIAFLKPVHTVIIASLHSQASAAPDDFVARNEVAGAIRKVLLLTNCSVSSSLSGCIG